jgi:hypothetical protein
VASRRKLPLWAAGLAVWAGVATVAGVLTTPAVSGCDQQAMAGAIAWGGAAGLPLIVVDVVRRRRAGVGVLAAWVLLVSLSAWGAAGAPPPDCDHLVSVLMTAMFLPLHGGFAAGLVLAGAALWRWLRRIDGGGPIDDRAPPGRPRRRHWRVRVEGSSLVVTRRPRKD